MRYERASRQARTWLLGLLVFSPGAASAQAADATLGRPMDVLLYSARLEPDLQARSLRGHVEIDLVVPEPGRQWLEFDTGGLSIDGVREGDRDLVFEKRESKLRVQVPAAPDGRNYHRIEVDYHGSPGFGLEFHPERNELYTIFSTSQWLVSVDAPDERAALHLELVLPAGMQSVGNGVLASTSRLSDGRERHLWRLDRPVPGYLYGFAAGPYRRTSVRTAGTDLHFYSIDRSEEELQRIFADSGDMLRFFRRRAGLDYRGDYSQVLVSDTVGQELAGFSLMSEEFGRNALAESGPQTLVAHELAHQWWGNRITCRDWGHFWLNEGFASFMAAAYVQHRFGDAEYRKLVDAWRRRVERLQSEGKDHALVYASWSRPSRDDRAVVYQKGAYVLHLLREQLGERAFWRGLRNYTRRHDGQSVTSADFQRAMERASGRDLSRFFARWVYGTSG